MNKRDPHDDQNQRELLLALGRVLVDAYIDHLLEEQTSSNSDNADSHGDAAQQEARRG